jgi:hypothetical protein
MDSRQWRVTASCNHDGGKTCRAQLRIYKSLLSRSLRYASCLLLDDTKLRELYQWLSEREYSLVIPTSNTMLRSITRLHHSARALTICGEVTRLVHAILVTETLSCSSLVSLTGDKERGPLRTNSDELQVIRLGPVDQPRRKRVDGAGIGLMHEGDVTVAARAGL